jgi:DNA-binding transcriptional regulator YiaG
MKKIDVAAVRKNLGLTQAAFAERLGVDQSLVSRLETGKLEPSGPVLIILRQIMAEPSNTDEAAA